MRQELVIIVDKWNNTIKTRLLGNIIIADINLFSSLWIDLCTHYVL